MPPMRKVPAGIYTWGIPSVGEIRSVAASSIVGEAPAVGATVGLGVSSVADGITPGVIVGSGVDLTTGISVPAQAVSKKMKRKIGISLLIDILCDPLVE